MRYFFLLFSFLGIFLCQKANAYPNIPHSTVSKNKQLRCQAPAAPEQSYPARDQLSDQKTYRFLGMKPIVPLALVRNGEISSAGQGRCKAWSDKKQIWQAVDAYGQTMGEFHVKEADYYDVSKCEELTMEPVQQNQPGVGLFVAKDTGWKSPMNIKWNPTTIEKQSLKEFVEKLEKNFIPSQKQFYSKEKQKPLLQRTLFFWMPAFGGDDLPRRYAVVGGPFLLVASLENNCHWVIHYMLSEASWHDHQQEYQPIAVFDMNHDGEPEIIFHHDMGPDWDDEILTLTNGSSWSRVAESVGGGTW